MATKFKIVKRKEFSTSDGKDGVHYTVAYKGRVFGLNTLRFEEESEDCITEDNGVLIVKCELQLKKNTVTDLDEKRTYVDLLPKLDLQLSKV